jgi:enoyl-CoA hydratase/carnithine racemase
MSDAVFQDLTLVVNNGVATITLNRIDAMNSLNMSLKGELTQAIAQIAHDPKVRAVLSPRESALNTGLNSKVSSTHKHKATPIMNVAFKVIRAVLPNMND